MSSTPDCAFSTINPFWLVPEYLSPEPVHANIADPDSMFGLTTNLSPSPSSSSSSSSSPPEIHINLEDLVPEWGYNNQSVPIAQPWVTIPDTTNHQGPVYACLGELIDRGDIPIHLYQDTICAVAQYNYHRAIVRNLSYQVYEETFVAETANNTFAQLQHHHNRMREAQFDFHDATNDIRNHLYHATW